MAEKIKTGKWTQNQGPSCKYNSWVECLEPVRCAHCGWNEAVRKRRIERAEKKLAQSRKGAQK